MAACRKLLLPSIFSVLFCFSLLSANLEEKSSKGPLGDGYVRTNIIAEDEDGSKSDETLKTVSPDNRARAHSSTLLPRHQALIFNPPSLDFRETCIGMPRLEVVTITNPSSTQPLQLTSISGDSPTFHASFFRSKVVKAGESTSFDVVFLPRVVGLVRNILYIQSSQGTFEYEVQGMGTPNPFRLRALLGARIPLNATYSPFISMYNPYNSPLQITEMYSSSGELHLELLTGQSEGPKALWEIRPYETKAIARASFFGAAVANYTSFVRLKTNHQTEPSVVLPVEIEVSNRVGLFLSRELLDFGIVKGGETKVLPLYVLNAGQQQVHIKSVSILPENDAIEIEYMTTLLRPGSKYTKIALLKLHADKVTFKSQMSGHVVIRGEDKFPHQLDVPYEASVLTGSLSYDKASTLFRPGPPPFQPILRHISLSNQFESPLVVYDAKLPSKAQEYFAVSPQDTPFTLAPSTHWSQSLAVVFMATSTDCFFNTSLRLSTNATFFSIPLICYDGRVKYSLENPDQDSLEFGALSRLDVVTKSLTVHNINPVKISIESYSISPELPFASIQLHSIHPTNTTPHTIRTPTRSTPPHTLEPDHSARLMVTVSNPDIIGTYSGEILVKTSFERVLHVPLYFKTTENRLKIVPEEINLKRVFPYLRSKVSLNVKNLHHQPVGVTSVDSDLDDPRLYFEESIDGLPRLKPAEKVEIGSVIFDPLVDSIENVYLRKPARSESLWSTSSAPRDTTQEVQVLSSLWSKWKALLDQGLTLLNTSMVVNSDPGGEMRVPIMAGLIWPDLVSERLVTLEPTTIGNTSIHQLYITNPSDVPLFVQPVLLSHYTYPQTIIDSLNRFDPRLQTLNFSLSSNSFSLVSSHASSDTALVPTVLAPHSNHTEVVVAFSPKVDQELNMLLLLRNNLTVFDYVVVQGSGIQGVFAIDGVQPGTDPLMFEFPNSVLENCLTGTLTNPHSDSLKITKMLRMHNSGSTPIVLRIIGLEGGLCKGRGFTVSACNKDITIKPNRSKKFEIMFTPDYTLTQVSNTLHIQTSSGEEFLYPLLVILPHQLLAACIAFQPRSDWEKTLAWLSVPFWVFVLLCVVATVFVQTKFSMKSRPSTDVSTTKASEGLDKGIFDLNKLTKTVEASLSKKFQALEEKSVNERLEKSVKNCKPAESPKASVEKRSPVPKPNPVLTPTTAQETIPVNQLRHRTIQTKTNRDTVESVPASSASPSKPFPVVSPTVKRKALKIPVEPVVESSAVSSLRMNTDNHTGLRELTQPCTPTTGAPVQVNCSSPNKTKRSEKIFPEKPVPKIEAPAKFPPETSSQVPIARKSKMVRKITPRSLRATPDSPSVPPPPGFKQLERKVSESSIISTNSDSASTSTDKSEEAETPANQLVVVEAKKPPPPVTKEPNTGQTIHPPDTPDATDNNTKTEQMVEVQKKESISTGPSVRVKGKRKLRQQLKKEEKARRKEKERGKEQEKDIDKDIDVPAKQSSISFEDSSSSNSTEQLEEDSSPTINTAPAEVDMQCDKSYEKPDRQSDAVDIDGESSEPIVSVPPTASAVPSSAIKTGRINSTKQPPAKETLCEPASLMLEKPTVTRKVSSSKKPLEKVKPLPTSNKGTQLVEGTMETLPAEVARQRPQTLLPEIKTEEIDEPILEIPMHSDSLVETDSVSQGLLSVEATKGAQSVPTSPHELAASLLSNNSAIRRRQRSDRDKPDNNVEDDEDLVKSDDHQQDRVIKEPVDAQDHPDKDELSQHSNKSLSTLSCDAVPFYPSPSFKPKPGSSPRVDPRKYPDYPSHPRGPPPGFSPTPDDPYMRPYHEGPYLKRDPHLPHPIPRGGKSMTPSPPLPYGMFPEGPHMHYGEYPPHDHHEPMGMHAPYDMPDDFPPPPPPPPPPPMGRYSREHYRGRSPMMPPSHSRHMHSSMEAYMRYVHRYGHRPHGPWDYPPLRRMKPPPIDESMYQDQQYLRERQYIVDLINQERAIAAMEREQGRHPPEGPSLMYGPDSRLNASPPFGSRAWDNPDLADQPPDEAELLLHYQPSRVIPEKPPIRRRTYSTESDLGGEFVTDLPASSSAGAPGQQVLSQGERSTTGLSKSLAPGKSRSSGWPGDVQGSSPNWDDLNLWSTDTPLYSTNSQNTVDSISPNESSTGRRSLSSPLQPFSNTTYDLFENQSIWSLSNSDSSTLLSWAQQKSESKTE